MFERISQRERCLSFVVGDMQAETDPGSSYEESVIGWMEWVSRYGPATIYWSIRIPQQILCMILYSIVILVVNHMVKV